MIKIRKYVIYKITNIINNHIYIGVHSTYKINDSYMGSGTNVVKAIKEEGRNNFKKDVLYIYDNEQEALDKEVELVNEDFIARTDTYNTILGGGKLTTKGCVCVNDKSGNKFMIHKSDPRYISGELVSIHKGKITAKDIHGNIFRISTDDPRYVSGELIGHTKGKITVKDKTGKAYQVNKNDPRYISGELTGMNKGNKASIETKQKMSNAKLGELNNMYGKRYSNEYKDHLRNIIKKASEKYCKEFYVYSSINGSFISKEKGIGEYSKLNNMDRLAIIAVLKGRRKNYNNLLFFYEDKGENCFNTLC